MNGVQTAANLVGTVANVASIIDQQPDFLRSTNRQDRSHINADDLRLVNSRFYGDRGTTQNCTKCTAALELRKRGYDVIAGRCNNGALKSAFEYWFDGARSHKANSPERAFEILKSFGRKGTGNIDFRYPTGGGHSVYFQNTNQGFLEICDGQTGNAWRVNNANDLSSVMKKYGFLNDSAHITRLDDCTPNFKHMAEDSVLRVSFKNQNLNKVKNRRDGRLVDTW